MTMKSQNTMFHYQGLTLELHPYVYEPAEDTFQLLEAIFIQPGDSILELGTGCGLIGIDCARRGCTLVCTDINPHAVQLTNRNIKRNRHLLKGTIEVREGGLFSVLKKDERFTTIIFNPPYLPTDAHERITGDKWFNLATDGGSDGLSLTKQFIKGVPSHLIKGGHAYFVFSSLANRDKLNHYLLKEKAFHEIVLSRRFNDEMIDIYCIRFSP